MDGWAKDQDANTAFSQTVVPLPFHAMSAYPYPNSERFPSDPVHRAYEEQYNTRPALRLVRPLVDSAADHNPRPFPGGLRYALSLFSITFRVRSLFFPRISRSTHSLKRLGIPMRSAMATSSSIS